MSLTRNVCRTDDGAELGGAPGRPSLPPLALGSSVALFGVGALLLLLTTRVAVPAFQWVTKTETVVSWFLAASIVLFAPLLLVACLMLRREWRQGVPWLSDRLRFCPMSASDWRWAVGGVAVVSVLTGGIATMLQMLHQAEHLHPAFMTFEPLGPGRYWILGAWLPFFALNVLGEEFVWRGVVLPRQEVAFGDNAWLVNGLLWLLFHAAFPWQVLLTLLPITLVLPYAVQRRRCTWIGVVIHATFGAMGFLALAFGVA